MHDATPHAWMMVIGPLNVYRWDPRRNRWPRRWTMGVDRQDFIRPWQWRYRPLHY